MRKLRLREVRDFPKVSQRGLRARWTSWPRTHSTEQQSPPSQVLCPTSAPPSCAASMPCREQELWPQKPLHAHQITEQHVTKSQRVVPSKIPAGREQSGRGAGRAQQGGGLELKEKEVEWIGKGRGGCAWQGAQQEQKCRGGKAQGAS